MTPTMAAIPLKPEYGPTLGQLLAPRWRAASRLARTLTLAAAAILLALLAGLALTLENAHYSHGGPVPFSFSYRYLYRTATGPDEYVRVEHRAHGRLEDSVAVGPLLVPAYRSAPRVELPLYATYYIRAVRRRYSDFALSGEGGTQVAGISAYHILYTTRVQGHTLHGRDILVLPGRGHPRAGLRIVMLASRALDLALVSQLKTAPTGPLELPLNSFSIG
jgi:hypothetical protein